MKHIMKFISCIGFILCSILLASCNSGTASSASLPPTATENTVVLGNVTTIPLTNNIAQATYLVITNNSTEPVALTDAAIIKNNILIPANIGNDLVDTSPCTTLASLATCKVEIKTNNTPSDFIIRMIYTGSNTGKQYSGTQIISYSSNSSVYNGFNSSSTNNVMNRTNNNIVTMSIPFILGENYTNLNVSGSNDHLTTDFTCPNNSYSKGTLCTAFVTADNGSAKAIETDKLSISGTVTSSSLSNTRIVDLSLTASSTGNLITSASNVIISPATTAQTIWLVNNGNASINSITISPSYPVTVQLNTCGTSLAIGAACSFQVIASSASVSGQLPLYVSYNNGQASQVAAFNTIYILAAASPALQMVANGNFLNTAISAGPAFMPIVITNTGNVTLSNLQFSSISSLNAAMSYGTGNANTCNLYGGTSLTTGESCTLIVSYDPTATQSGTVSIYATGTYLDQNGATNTYQGTTSTFAYSAISASTFITVGDLGVSASTTAAATAWTVAVNVPCSSNTSTVEAITSGTSNGTVFYGLGNNEATIRDTLGGVIWESGAATGLTSVAPYGLIWDGSNFYATGAPDLVVRSTSISTPWTTVYTSTSAPEGLFYFPGVGYLVALATPSQLAQSATGASFSVPTISGTAQQNNAVLFSSARGSYYAFGSTGFASTATSLAGPWTNNATTRPGNATTDISGAVESAGLFVITSATSSTAQGGIWTTTNPTSVAYTQRFTGSSAANSVLNSIASGNGVYIAVGNNGHIESTTNPTGTWTDQTLGTLGFTNVYFDGSYFWALGANCTIKISTNGVAWTVPTLNSVTLFNGTTYVAVGSFGTIYTSPTTLSATSWSFESAPTNQTLNYVDCMNANVCAAVGNAGTIVTSTNAVNWNTQTSGVSANLNGIACGPTICVAVGNSGTILSSPDLIHWTTYTSGTTQSLQEVTYFNGTFLTVGTNGTILLSKDGMTWVSEASGTTNQLNSVKCNNLVCIAVGNGVVVYSTSQGFIWATATGTGATGNNLVSLTIFNGTYMAVSPSGAVAYGGGAAPTPWSSWVTATAADTPTFIATTVKPGLNAIYGW